MAAAAAVSAILNTVHSIRALGRIIITFNGRRIITIIIITNSSSRVRRSSTSKLEADRQDRRLMEAVEFPVVSWARATVKAGYFGAVKREAFGRALDGSGAILSSNGTPCTATAILRYTPFHLCCIFLLVYLHFFIKLNCRIKKQRV